MRRSGRGPLELLRGFGAGVEEKLDEASDPVVLLDAVLQGPVEEAIDQGLRAGLAELLRALGCGSAMRWALRSRTPSSSVPENACIWSGRRDNSGLGVFPCANRFFSPLSG
jgi:hypothetical protein